MDYSPTLLFFIACGFLSAWLSFSIAYLMLKSWRIVRVDFLLGFPAGFSLLALAFVVLDIAYVFPLTNDWNWASLLLGFWGFVFLAVTYYLRYGSGKASRVESANSTFSTLGVLTLSTFVLVFLIPPRILPSYLIAELEFRAVNIIVLGYILYNLNKGVKTETGLSAVVLGFTFLIIDQFSLLLNVLDRTFVWPVVFAQLVRIAGLFTLTIFLVQGFERRTSQVV